jgi:Family of unknown function (DUF5335)
MSLREIPRTEWIDFCRTFTASHRGCPVTVEISGGDAQRPLVRGEPLKAVSAELEEPDGDGKIVISTGAEPPDRTFQAVKEPVGIALEETTSGDHEGIRIESKGGTVTTLSFARR